MDFNKGISTGVEVDNSGSMSLGDIIGRHTFKQKEEGKDTNSKSQAFLIDTPNRYEVSQDSKKVVQINILEIIFDNKICNLIYIHDITNFF